MPRWHPPETLGCQKEQQKYNRNEVIATITTFYQLLAKLPCIELADILYPPAGGWPNITKENFACLDRNEKVIELLKRLPYVKMSNDREYMIAPQIHQGDYQRDYFQSRAFTKSRSLWEVPHDFKYPPWVVLLTNGKNHGSYFDA
jgi:hypothetical protein